MRLASGLGLAGAIMLASAGSTQILSSGPILGGPVGGVVNDVMGSAGRIGQQIDRELGEVSNTVTPSDVQQAATPTLSRLSTDRWIADAPAATLEELRRLRLANLVKASGGLLEMGPSGNPVKRGRLIAIDPNAAQLKAAASAGFAMVEDEADQDLGIRMVVLAAPRGMDARTAQRRLRAAVPGLNFDFDHAYEPAGGALVPITGAILASSAASSGGPLIGMVDGGVASAPSLARASIEQRGFSGRPQPTGHGTAVASLIVGSDGKFAGAARGARLVAADVYGGNTAAGSATSVVKALSWLASKRPAVINISLVGPRNAIVERSVSTLLARGIKIVAPVGNDGPAAPPLYPANQAGVIAVTGVDADNRAIREAGRALHLDYAAPGADMAAALPGKGYARVRGTSFAAPYVAARLALAGSTQRLDREAAKGKGRVGRGVVCADCRIAPKRVGAK